MHNALPSVQILLELDWPYRAVMKVHLELVEVEPVAGLCLVEVVVEISRREAKRVELFGRRQQQRRWCLLIDDARVSALPSSHHVNLHQSVMFFINK